MSLYVEVADLLIDGPKFPEELFHHFPAYTKKQVHDALRNAGIHGLAHVKERVSLPGLKGQKSLWAYGPKPGKEAIPATPRGEYAWVGPVSSVWELSLRA
jgi:hypothetical protein